MLAYRHRPVWEFKKHSGKKSLRPTFELAQNQSLRMDSLNFAVKIHQSLRDEDATESAMEKMHGVNECEWVKFAYRKCVRKQKGLKMRKTCTGKLWQNFCIISENSWEIFEIFIIIDLFSIKVQKLWKC